MQNLCKIFMLLLMAAFIMTGLNACGRYSKASPVPGSGFPHSYPHGQE